MSICVGKFQFRPIKTIEECIDFIAKIKKHKITYSEENDDTNISDMFSFNNMYLNLFKSIIKTKNFYIQIDYDFLKVVWDCNEVQNIKHTQSIIEFLYEKDIEDSRSSTPQWSNKEINVQNPNVVYEYIKKSHAEELLSENIPVSVQHKYLVPELRPYQSSAVRWMINREFNEDMNYIMNPLYITLTTPDGTDIYYSPYLNILNHVKPLVKSLPTGGILADEMGLGKTVEILSLILKNPRKTRVSEFESEGNFMSNLSQENRICGQIEAPSYHDQIAEMKIILGKLKSNVLTSNAREYLNSMYENTLRSISPKKRKDNLDKETKSFRVQCVCGLESNRTLIQCVICDKIQHFECLYKKDPSIKKTDVHLCPRCWKYEQKVVSGATLIVSPLAISEQWLSEINKHIERNKLKVFVYKGIKKGWISPITLANQDIVLTTYNILQSEFFHNECNDDKISRGRYARRYDVMTSPLMFVEWWRICLDEGQMVGSNFSQVAKMAQNLTAVHRWAVTGTPVQKTVEDLYGLISFLNIEPYADHDTWSWLLFVPYVLGNTDSLLSLLSKIMWRTEKKDVNDQINIPPQSTEAHWLDLSEIETFYYKRQHYEYGKKMLEKIKNYDSSLTLGSLDVKTLNLILQPLLNLRQICTQPNVQNSKMAGNKQMLSMSELLGHLIATEKNRVEEWLRYTISDLNGIAGFSILEEDFHYAIKIYNEVLALSTKYENTFHIDSLLKIHALSNLYEISVTRLEPNSEIPEEIKNYKETTNDLEFKYMQKYIEQVSLNTKDHEESVNEINKILNSFDRPMNHWWQELLTSFYTNNKTNKLVSKIRTELHSAFGDRATQNGEWDCPMQYDHKLKSWCANLQTHHDRLVALIGKLQITEINADYISKSDHFRGLSIECTACHLRPDKDKKRKRKKKDCRLCVLGKEIETLERFIYSMVERKPKSEAVCGYLNEGSWKPSHEEFVIKTLSSMSVNDEEFKSDIDLQLKLIEAYKVSFKNSRKLWISLDALVAAEDELTICKSRMELQDESETTGEPSKKIPKVLRLLGGEEFDCNEQLNVFRKIEISAQIRRLEVERQIHSESINKCIKTLSYLNSLKKNYEGMEFNNDTCPVCLEVLGKEWAVFTCGHSYCVHCAHTICSDRNAFSFQKCCVCRQEQILSRISIVKLERDVNDIKVEGNNSTKIHGIVHLVLSLKKKDQTVKILIFSQWESILELIGLALKRNNVRYELYSNSNPHNVSKFKNASLDITCLLLPLRFGSKGLNLIEATHVILTEPLLNPGEEKQATSRVHRIGQTKPTTVHQFIIRKTVEEQIYNTLNKCNSESKDDCVNFQNKNLTISQLANLFPDTDEILMEDFKD